MNPAHAPHIIAAQATLRQAIEQLNTLPKTLTLFVYSEADARILGSVTDGDVRRALLAGCTLESPVADVMFTQFRHLAHGTHTVQEYHDLRALGLKIIPVLDAERRLVRLVNTQEKRSLLPLDVVIMAGGEGRRLLPLTANTPKPLLPVGGMPIIERNIERLSAFGVQDIWITVNYLGQQLVDHFGTGQSRGLSIRYVDEAGLPLGTFGSIALAQGLAHDHVLVMNSDLLTNIDFEDFFLDFLAQDADMAVASTPYEVRVPYAVLERDGRRITSFREKPTYTYYSNAGIYLVRRPLLGAIPVGQPHNATDFMENLISTGRKVVHYPILGYWLDIGKHEDYERAQQDVARIPF